MMKYLTKLHGWFFYMKKTFIIKQLYYLKFHVNYSF
jgi:hypothetical protein